MESRSNSDPRQTALKKTIVITSIFQPTEAVRAFVRMSDHHTIVVGDKKTPAGWSLDGVDYLSVEKQEKFPHSLARHLPFNHYCRKMLGYLRAIERGAEVVIDTDDDNIPKPGWSFPPFDGIHDQLPAELGFINIYRLFTRQHIWPRGLPLDSVLKKTDLETSPGECRVGIWQGLADGDPDVDAIYRLTNGAECLFESRAPVVLGAGTVTPFNSQNTAIRRELFPLLYLPVFVTFRFTDILRGLVAQPIMAASGYSLGFIDANVFQERNPHDYMKDFDSEIPVYQHSRAVFEIASDAVSSNHSVESNLLAAYLGLQRAGIVAESELDALRAWLFDLEKIQARAS
jgi:hypothetical protein